MADHPIDKLISVRAQVCVLQQALEFHEGQGGYAQKAFSKTCFAIENELTEILTALETEQR